VQILPPGLPGTMVACRGRCWHVGRAVAAPSAVMLDLHPVRTFTDAAGLRVLCPPDVPVVVAPRRRRYGRRAWLTSAVSAMRGAWRAGWTRVGPGAYIEALPYQWVVAGALLSARVRHVLLADAVGLGKTVQAALAVAELHARDMTARSLIVVPASLLGQWEAELHERFGLEVRVLDAAGLRQHTDLTGNHTPVDAGEVCLVSLDMLRLPEVAAAMSRVAWRLLVVDEAHLLAPGTARRVAVQTVLPSVAQLLLLTATPWADADTDATHLLRLRCGGARHDRMLVVARPGDVLARPVLRQRVVRVRPTTRERLIQAQIATYLARARTDSPEGSAGRLAAVTLARRASSCADALRHSVHRRIAMVGREFEGPVQPELPLGSEPDGDDAAWIRVPAWSDVGAERMFLRTIADTLGREASTSKLHWVDRWLRRCSEPAVVFTEYVDTLRALQRLVGASRRVVCLYGAQTSEQRRLAIERFTDGTADLLLATDAAAEGLNLHHRCRLVIHVDVPWSPRRLDQRNGRVDRLGQTMPVRALLLANSPGYDDHVLAALDTKRSRLLHLDVSTCRDLAVVASGRRARLAEAARTAWTLARRSAGTARSAEDEVCCVLTPRRWRRLRQKLRLPAAARAVCIAEVSTVGGHPLAAATRWVAWSADGAATRSSHDVVASTLPAICRFVRRRQVISDRFAAGDADASRAADASATRDLFTRPVGDVRGTDVQDRYPVISAHVVSVWELACRR
jgi:superfamily II DNA or RNA helicase